MSTSLPPLFPTQTVDTKPSTILNQPAHTNGLSQPLITLDVDSGPKTSPTVKATTTTIDTAEPAGHLQSAFHLYQTREHLELEAKLGQWRDGRFISGVSEEKFNQIMTMLQSYPHWSNPNHHRVWNTIFDYILDNNIRVSKTNKGNVFMRKTAVSHVTYSCPERPWDVRVSLKEELPVKVQLPQEPRKVRVKKRRSFRYKDTWQFDLTVVWSGRDEQEAQAQPPTYEVECELLLKPGAIEGPPHQRYLARSLLEKMIDFLGRADPLTLIKV